MESTWCDPAAVVERLAKMVASREPLACGKISRTGYIFLNNFPRTFLNIITEIKQRPRTTSTNESYSSVSEVKTDPNLNGKQTGESELRAILIRVRIVGQRNFTVTGLDIQKN